LLSQLSHDSEYDQRILEITEELCLQLDILNYKPTFVSWETLDSRSRRGAEFPNDECLIEHWCVTLSGRMRGMLETDDWRPIIASSLISSKKLRKKILRMLGLSLAFVLFSAIALSALGYFTVVPVAFFVGLPSALVAGLVYTRRTRLIADRKASDLVSAATFLTTLNKIVKQSPGGVQQGPTDWNLWAVRLGKPNIQERISNLQAYSRQTKQKP
jgi:hypothetical protein